MVAPTGIRLNVPPRCAALRGGASITSVFEHIPATREAVLESASERSCQSWIAGLCSTILVVAPCTRPWVSAEVPFGDDLEDFVDIAR